MTSITIPNSVTNIGDYAFADCYRLTGAYFLGNAPTAGPSLFSGDTNAVYFMPGTFGWGPTFGGRPVAPWPAAYWTYTVNSGTITVTGYTGPGGVVIIPSTVYGLPVTSIGDYAFSTCANLTNVSVPDSVITLGNYAFYYCSDLISITTGKSLTSIGFAAFHSCTNLASVKLGNAVTNIGDYALAYCYSLANVTLPNSVTLIGTGAFATCSRLTSITLGNNVTNIGALAFQYCTHLTSITIPAVLTASETLLSMAAPV